MQSSDARKALVSLLERAHAGELAAAFAYRGHWRSLPPGGDRDAIQRIEREELEHRSSVGEMLSALGAAPSRSREAVFWLIGHAVGALCHVSGWFAPMYGAGRLEAGNIVEYEVAVRLALEAGRPRFAASLSRMAEVEAEHERFFRQRVLSHWLGRVVPIWAAPAPAPVAAPVEPPEGLSLQSPDETGIGIAAASRRGHRRLGTRLPGGPRLQSGRVGS